MPINLSKFKGYQSGGISWAGIERLRAETSRQSTVPKTDRREVEAKKAAQKVEIPSYNQSSPFYNVPIIGGMLKRDEEKTRKVADEILSERERNILAEGLKYKYTTRNMGGGITQYFFETGQNIPEDVKRNFQSVMEKVDYAKKSGIEKIANRAGRQSIATAVGDKGVKEYAAQAGIDDAGKIGNVVGDIAGTLLGYNMPSGATGGGTVMGGANRFGEYAIQRAGTKIPQLITKPIVGRVAQGLIEDIPMTAYSALAERQSLGEAAKTYARNAPLTIGGELAGYGLGKVGKALRKGVASRAAKKAAGLADDVGRAAGVDDELQQAITTPRPKEAEQLAEELRNAEPIATGQAVTPSVNKIKRNFVKPSSNKPIANTYDEYQKIIDDLDDKLINQYGEEEWMNGVIYNKGKIPKAELDYYNKLTDERNAVWEAEKASNIEKTLNNIQLEQHDDEWVASRDSIKEALTKLQNDATGVFADTKTVSVDDIKRKLYNRLIQATDAPDDLWGEYEYAKRIAEDDGFGPFGKSLKPLFKQIDDIVDAMGKTDYTETLALKQPSKRYTAKTRPVVNVSQGNAPSTNKAAQNGVQDVPEQFKGAEFGDPDYKPVKVGAQVQIVRGRKQTPKFEYADPELETIHKQNKGIPEATFLQKVKKGVADALNMFTRPIGTLKYTKENAELYKDLVRLPKLRAIASDDTVRTMQTIVKEMDRNGFDMFERKVFLDDLAEEVKLGNKLPNKWTAESIQSELARLDDAMPESVRTAVDTRQKFWNEVKDNYIKSMKDIGVDMSDRMTRENYFRHQVLDYMEAKNSISGSGRKLRSPTGRGFTKARTGEFEGNISTDYLQAEFEVMAQMKHDTEVAKIIKNVDNVYNIADKVKTDAKAQGIKDWHEAIPEGYTVWQPREGNAFYMSQPLGAEIVEQALSLRGIKLDNIKDPKLKVVLEDIMNDLADQTSVLAMGGKRKEFVVTEEIAETLNNLAKVKTTNALSRLSKKVMNTWKQWVLTLNPKSVFKYNVRNFTGDLDAIIAGNPGAVKKIPKATKELFDAVQNGKFTPELKSWYDRGGYQSLLYAQEISQVNKMKPFERLRDLSVAEKITKPLKTYAEFTKDATNFREAINRYAAYVDYLDQLKSGKLKNYGASRPEIIDGIKGVEDKAFKLSNDLLGAYDEVSQAGQVIRNHLVPFYSWMEINMKRYKNLFKNAFTNKEVAKSAGLSAKLVAKLGVKTAGKLAGIFATTGALAVWNQLKYADLEETLPEDVRERPHIILGQDKDGNTLYFSRLGSLNDFLEWFGLDTADQDVKDILNGKKTVQEQLTDMVKSPLNKVAGSITPAYKTTAELLTGQKLYPDITNPTPIRDKAQYAAQSLGMRDEYDVIAGKPHRPYFENLNKALLYKADPDESAYYSILNEKRKYKNKKGEESNLFFYTKKSNALYNWKLAKRYGDKKAEKKYLKEYFELGGTTDGITKSLSSMNPLYGMNADQQAEFVAGLTEKEKGKLKAAMKYYNDVLKNKESE
jgi:hypothetical protein